MSEFFESPVGKALLFGVPLLSFSFIAFQPAALQLYFTTVGAWALVQAYVVNNHSFRKTMGLAILDPAVNKKDGMDLALLEKKSKSLAALEKRLAEETRYAAEERRAKSQPAQSDQNLSSIDRWLNQGKKTFQDFTADAGKKMRSFSGQATENADGSGPAPPRLTDTERQLAQEYEEERQALDAYARSERNEARRRAHQQALETERKKAQAAWAKQKQAASNKRKPRK